MAVFVDMGTWMSQSEWSKNSSTSTPTQRESESLLGTSNVRVVLMKPVPRQILSAQQEKCYLNVRARNINIVAEKQTEGGDI